MQIRLRQFALAAALSVGASAVAGIPAMGQHNESQQYPHRSSTDAQGTEPDTYANHPDYSNNEYYRTGNDEGYQDYQAKKQREKHEHPYRSDDDRRAHDYGYQEGWSGRSYRDRNSRSGQTYRNDQYRSGEAYGSQSRDRNGQYQSGEYQKQHNNDTYGSRSRDRNGQYGDQKHDNDDDHDHDRH